MEQNFQHYIQSIFKVDGDNRLLPPEIKENDGNYYPNCDVTVWLRSCEKEILEPIHGVIKGVIPNWINGSLLRNGPGSLKVGNMQFDHLFDSSALVHRFGISNGKVTYQCRFIQTDTFRKNTTAQRIVVSEFGTSAVPDPCQSIFKKVSSIFYPNEGSDNTMISIYPFGDEYFAFTEHPVIHRINPITLETETRVRVSDYVGIVNHTSHPHVQSDGTVFNLGLTVSKTGPAYNIICFPHGERMFENAYIVGTIPCRWKLHPGYMHSFGITENYFIIVEQPLSVSVPRMICTHITNEPMASCLKWFNNKNTLIHILDRNTGTLKYSYKAEPFFFLHIINQYEINDEIVLDICCYKDASMLNCMYIESMTNMQKNPQYASMFRARPLRFILPLPKEKLIKSPTLSELNFSSSSNKILKRSKSENENLLRKNFNSEKNHIQIFTKLKNYKSMENDTYLDSNAAAYHLLDNSVFVKPELLCKIGCETPRINYENFVGKCYRFFYAISCDVDADNPGMLLKVDTKNKEVKTWCEPNCYPSEPIFLPRPGSMCEDDGVVLSSMVWGTPDVNRVGLLVLCALTWHEIGRCEFKTPGPVPKCLHGWFIKSKENDVHNK